MFRQQSTARPCFVHTVLQATNPSQSDDATKMIITYEIKKKELNLIQNDVIVVPPKLLRP